MVASELVTSTSYFKGFQDFVKGSFEVEKKKRALSLMFHETMQDLVKAVGMDNAAETMENASKALDVWAMEEFKDILNGQTLSKGLRPWQQYKSDYLNGLKMGINPLDYPNHRQFVDEKLGKNKPATNNGTGGTPVSSNLASQSNPLSNNTGAPPVDNSAANDSTSNVISLPHVKNNSALVNSAMEKFNKLASIDTEEALRILKGFEGRLTSCLRSMEKADKRLMAAKLNKKQGGDKATATG